MKKIKSILIFTTMIIPCFLFSACWDKFEPEERGFVTAIGIDKGSDNEFNISVEVPEMSIFENDSDSQDSASDVSENGNSYVESCTGNTVWSAIKTIDGVTDRKLDFGQIKLCVIGEEILKNKELFQQTEDALERNKDIWRKVLICATKQNAEGILKGYDGDRKTAGFFATAFFNNNKKSTDLTFKRDLENILSDLSMSGNTAIPVVSTENGEIYFSGMAVIRDYTLVGYCENEIIKGFNIISEDISETDIVTDYNGIKVPLKVNKKNTDISFVDDNNKVKCIITTDIDGDVEEFRYDDVPVSELENAYNSTVTKYIKDTFSYFKNTLKTDVLQLNEKCRKKENSIYKKYNGNVFNNMELEVNAYVHIKGMGTID